MEKRSLANPPECRATDDGQRIAGYGALFNVETVIGGMFREQIDPHAFDGVLGGDIRSAYNHNLDVLLGRTAAGTLAVDVDARGLRYSALINDKDPAALSVLAKVQRGDVTGSSFAFTIAKDGERWDPPQTRGGLPLRTITRIGTLYEIGPVALPAYEETTAEARTKAEAYQVVEQVEAQIEARATTDDLWFALSEDRAA